MKGSPDDALGRGGPSLDSQAIGWLSRVEGGGLTDAERTDFETWHATPEHAAAYAQAQRLWSGIGVALDGLASTPTILHERERLLAKSSRQRQLRTAGVAASVALLVGVTLSGLTGHMSGWRALQAWWSGIVDPPALVFATAIGQRSMVTLPDGSELSLNTDSAAEVRYDSDERRVVLLKGQALFEVAKGRKEPFVVHAAGRRIVATGTAFDVRYDPSLLEVTMVEGHVVVYPSVTGGSEKGGGEEGLPLHAGERLVVREGRPAAVSGVDPKQTTSWTQGKLVFLATSLEDAIAEVNRYSATKMFLADPRLADLRISGVFRTGQPGEFGRAVAAIHPVAVRVSADGTLLLTSTRD